MQITKFFYLVFFITLPKFRAVFGIIGGTPAEYHPFFVLVPKGDELCGGVIVGSNIVLTAASCLYYDKMHRWATALEVHVLQVMISSCVWNNLPIIWRDR